MSSVPKSFFFGSLSSSSSSRQPSSASPSSPRSPRFSGFFPQPEPSSSSHSPPLADIRARSGSTAEPPKKRSGTFSSLTSFWDGNKVNEKEKQKEKEGHQHHHKEKENIHRHEPIVREPVRLHERDISKRGHKEEKKHEEKRDKDRKRFNSKEANMVISKEVLAAVQGLNEIQTNKPQITLSTSPSPSPPSSPSTSPPSSPRHSPSPTRHEQKKAERVKHKAKSEGSLLSAIFSRRFERGALMQKSSSLIELKPMTSPGGPTKSGSSIEIGKKSGYFGVTLQEAMEMQKERYPGLQIPVIMTKLTEAILLYGGCKAEGIFRVAGSTQQVHKMQQQFNSMNFDEIPPDPHVLIGVLKQWLRELREPLIPNCIYEECLQCETPTDCSNVIEKMPELNKATLAHFVTFLRELSKPEHLQYTKMDVHNLCLVSAPVLFRCPSTDMAELVVNMQKEKVFLGLVLESSAFTK